LSDSGAIRRQGELQGADPWAENGPTQQPSLSSRKRAPLRGNGRRVRGRVGVDGGELPPAPDLLEIEGDALESRYRDHQPRAPPSTNLSDDPRATPQRLGKLARQATYLRHLLACG
jgi:hypothetical protein